MNRKFKMKIMTGPFCILLIMAILLFTERSGLRWSQPETGLAYLPGNVMRQDKSTLETECLILTDSSQTEGTEYQTQMTDVLDGMRIGYEVFDVASQLIPHDLSSYHTVVIAFGSLDILKDQIFALCDWVRTGGRLMFFCTLEPTPLFRSIAQKIGVIDGGNVYAQCSGMKFESDFMLGAQGRSFPWDSTWNSSLAVTLSEECVVHVSAMSETGNVPMLWEYPSGDGKFVVNNHSVCEKASRGLTASAYCLLEDVAVYPVINASSFFFDDFPSPVPSGEGKYIRADFGRDIASFYTNVWWPDMLSLGEKYHLKYTGVMIEDYSDITSPPFVRSRNTERFRYFGGSLLQHQGEIGIHGYNHMPLCLDGFDFQGKVDYKTWPSQENMNVAISELLEFGKRQFPENHFAVYVPPSNILSQEGYEVLRNQFPEIRTIASLYLIEDFEYEQEFCVGEDGMIHYPRVVSGYLLDDYMYWAAMNELNFHFVNNYFAHPDDVLDEDRGAALGWEKLRQNLDSYMEWLYAAAPEIRNLTASEGSAAVERYDNLTVSRTDLPEGIRITLGGFYDEAYLMVCINEGKPDSVAGGSLEHISGNRYLLHAQSNEITIGMGR